MNITTLPFGIDVSFWEGVIDWDAIASHNPQVVFVGIKATEGINIVDPQFKRNWTEAKRVSDKRVTSGGLPIFRTAYHFLKTNQDPIVQAKLFLSTVGSDTGELPLTVDAEDGSSTQVSIVRDCVYRFANQITVSDHNRQPMIYSSASWINGYLVGTLNGVWNKPPLWLNTFNWWLAQYLRVAEEYPNLVDLPMGVDRDHILIQQTGDHLPSFGTPGSKMLDYDRWMGDMGSLVRFVSGSGSSVIVDPDPTPLPAASGSPLQFKVLNSMNIRNAPSLSAPVVGQIAGGTNVFAEDVGGANSWIKIGENQWICHSLGTINYLKEI